MILKRRKTMNKLRLCVCPVHRKCIDYEGEWDGTYNDSFEYIIYDSEGIEVAGWDGYNTAEQAREAGEKKLKAMEE
jgi:hypothetical protein